MRIAFVGIKRPYKEMPESYRDFFDQYHLELPYYYAKAGNDVTIVTTDDSRDARHVGNGVLRRVTEKQYAEIPQKYHIVVHWRKWFETLYMPGALNVVNCQDHSFSGEWIDSIRKAKLENKLYGILCFPNWHKENLKEETGFPVNRLLDGVTLGVDTDIYKPHDQKDPYQLLWASDPGRGFSKVVPLTIELFRRDKRYKLHVCYPDYVKHFPPVAHPAFIWHGSVQNGQKLWDLFNKCGVLPYTSTFKEPSSRAHRQAQAAGSLVLYPPAMGTPSDLIGHDVNGIVSDPSGWADEIHQKVTSGDWRRLGTNARQLALSENWDVQGKRFTSLFQSIIMGERK